MGGEAPGRRVGSSHPTATARRSGVRVGAPASPGAPGGDGVQRGGRLPGGDPTRCQAQEGDHQRSVGADYPLRLVGLTEPFCIPG